MTIRRSCQLKLPVASLDGPIDLLVVILNFRTPDLTIQCLESISAEVSASPEISVIVVDNASGDGSAERIAGVIAKRSWGTWAQLFASDFNGGFAWGNNRGIEKGPAARYVLLLNSDTIVAPGCLRASIDAMDRDPEAGLMITRLTNVDGSIQNVCRRFPTPLCLFLRTTGLHWRLPRALNWGDLDDEGWDRTRERKHVDWVAGAFTLIRREVLEQVGGLDEDFFFYGEDIEFCHRVYRAGWLRVYDPVGTVVHIGGASSDPTRLSSKNRHFLRARYLIQLKCYGWLAAAFARCVDIAAGATRLLWHFLNRRGDRWRDERERLRIILRPLKA